MERSSVIITLLKIGLSNIRLPQTSLAFHQNRTVEVKKPALKQENGFGFRLESGKSLLLEKDGTKAFEIKPTTNRPNGIILESNKNTLLESGSAIKQENNNIDMEDKDLKISELIPALQLDGNEIIPFAKDNANGSMLVSLLKAFITDGYATTSALNGKQNKLTPGYGIEITPENEIRTKLDVSPFEVVDELPTSDIKNKIYCVPDPDGEVGKNEYIEYLWLGDHWEAVGKFMPKVDLAPYLKATDAERIYAKISDIPDVSGFISIQTYNLLLARVAQLETKMTTVNTKLDSIPEIPANDQCVYAMQNGQWSEIAGSNKAVVTMTADESVSSEQTAND
ncbi:hypothetical protein [Lepagella muris]|uniref:Uncharacterized protein n=3 Tax=Bacteroidales TaxID=171549 RepID=A0AC61RJQ8_9BACT|nr:hypothetical protein [Lepagella muris]TGY80862.1 hypothetical protein E5331_00350 [Lepagella muris]THG53940.1 hypothetical protein E5984_00350 [Bacteroidales bacterium]TKC57369.1 hypothetical protein E5359_011935 [Bacteroidales bacterium]